MKVRASIVRSFRTPRGLNFYVERIITPLAEQRQRELGGRYSVKTQVRLLNDGRTRVWASVHENTGNGQEVFSPAQTMAFTTHLRVKLGEAGLASAMVRDTTDASGAPNGLTVRRA